MNGTFLDKILARKKAETRGPAASLAAPVPRRDFAATIRGRPGLKIIAEMKKMSPSRGLLREDYDPAALAVSYERAGAAALSVLTEPHFFGGSAEHLAVARSNSTLPILRKDFLTEPDELPESVDADAVLLIVAILSRQRLSEMLARARSLGLACVVEVHDEAELDAALEGGASIIGINNRDLRTFEVDLETTRRLRPRIPDDRIIVSESGLSAPEQLRALIDIGVDAALIGEAFMKSGNPGQRLTELLAGVQ
jgi:indole-3-glycerol phosphate synthase